MRPPAQLADRRQTLTTALLAFLAGQPPLPTFADEAGRPRITSRALLRISIGDELPVPLVLGLYGEEAPASVKLFESLCSGSLGTGLAYRGSSVSRIQRGKAVFGGSLSGGSTKAVEREIDSTGYVRSKTIDRAAAFMNDDQNGLRHDRAGLLSMKRGGGDFGFVITPAPNPELDAERVVVGEVVGEESFATLKALDELPVRPPSSGSFSEVSGVASLYGLRLGVGLTVGGVVGRGLRLGRLPQATLVGLGFAAASAIGSDPRDQPDLSYRPLTRVRIVSAAVERVAG